MQWRIQDFSDRGTDPKRGYTSLLFGNIFAENCIETKEIVPEGGDHS